jgi:hypothetical protein
VLSSGTCNNDLKLGDGCGVAERFGVLCVAQLVRRQGTDGQYFAKYMDPNSQCVSEANAHLSSVFVAGTGSYDQTDATLKPTVCGPGAPASCASKIGVPNKFMVQQVYNSPISEAEAPSSVGRKPGPSTVVTGVLQHTVLIDSEVSEVVAWLAPRRGHGNLDQQTGLLLQGCSSAATPACSTSAACREAGVLLVRAAPPTLRSALHRRGSIMRRLIPSGWIGVHYLTASKGVGVERRVYGRRRRLWKRWCLCVATIRPAHASVLRASTTTTLL